MGNLVQVYNLEQQKRRQEKKGNTIF